MNTRWSRVNIFLHVLRNAFGKGVPTNGSIQKVRGRHLSARCEVAAAQGRCQSSLSPSVLWMPSSTTLAWRDKPSPEIQTQSTGARANWATREGFTFRGILELWINVIVTCSETIPLPKCILTYFGRNAPSAVAGRTLCVTHQLESETFRRHWSILQSKSLATGCIAVLAEPSASCIY